MEGILLSASVICSSQPADNPCCGWSGPYGSYYDCKAPFSNNHRHILEKKSTRFITYRLWILDSTPGATQEGPGGD